MDKEGKTAEARKVVNVSSISGLYGADTQFSYSAAKSALVGMTRSLAKDWGRYNVTVNCVAFGHIALPPDWAEALPPIDQGWGNFLRRDAEREDRHPPPPPVPESG